jgi:hypothetical protein
MADLEGTPEQRLIFLNLHWGRMYEFKAPETSDGRWTARAKFGEHDELQEESASELLIAVRAHYAANKFPGHK